jgi:hypothetical protein
MPESVIANTSPLFCESRSHGAIIAETAVWFRRGYRPIGAFDVRA